MAVDSSEKTPNPEIKFSLGIRHVQLLLLFLAVACSYMQRTNISIAIVPMTNSTVSNGFTSYNWTSSQQDLVSSSFFWGYVCTQVPAGWLVHRYGVKYFLLTAILIASVITMLTPLAASVGLELTIATRVIQGLCQGFLFPSLHTMMSVWAPDKEQGTFSTIIFAGGQLGTIISLIVCGELISSSIGWPSCFWLIGSFGLIWGVLWFFFAASTPNESRFISVREKEYILANLKSKVSEEHKKSPTPFLSIMTSLPMWAIIVAHSTQNWGFWTLMTELPSFMFYVLNYKMSSNGLLSALPYFVMWLLSFVFGFIADYINSRKIRIGKMEVTLSMSRKFFNSIGHWIPGIAMLCLYLLPKDRVTVICLLTTAVGVNGATYVGFNINHIDLSPNHAGSMMGITNGIANLFSILGPLIVSVVVTDKSNADEWGIIFLTTACIYFVGNLFYVIFAKSEIQPWNSYT